MPGFHVADLVLVEVTQEIHPAAGRALAQRFGTANYAFVWAMGGDNQDFTDMDMVPMSVLR